MWCFSLVVVSSFLLRWLSPYWQTPKKCDYRGMERKVLEHQWNMVNDRRNRRRKSQQTLSDLNDLWCGSSFLPISSSEKAKETKILKCFLECFLLFVFSFHIFLLYLAIHRHVCSGNHPLPLVFIPSLFLFSLPLFVYVLRERDTWKKERRNSEEIHVSSLLLRFLSSFCPFLFLLHKHEESSQ